MWDPVPGETHDETPSGPLTLQTSAATAAQPAVTHPTSPNPASHKRATCKETLEEVFWNIGWLYDIVGFILRYGSERGELGGDLRREFGCMCVSSVGEQTTSKETQAASEEVDPGQVSLRAAA